ncbi:NAD(P)-binding protein [Dendrothele bispora CBS 962.96]|uniref:NAD(P)-binding protein n=1 Tax=Dendrothele bispora (strain CBS 962.96) TaxID=1314807 RepID=A0A4S8KTW3_DENBC|nr:NAD(P)-binding protein [Dendrothele bispora CBS 962.96]
MTPKPEHGRGLDLTGKVALVTGGGTGVGLIIAKSFVEHGARVYITGRREEVLKKVAADVNGSKSSPDEGGEIVPLQMDVTSKESIRNAVQFVNRMDGKLDVLVNNAGIANGTTTSTFFPFISDKSDPEHTNLGNSLFERSTFESWEEVLRTNTVAPFFVTMGFLELLEKGAKSVGHPDQSGNGRETSSVINISSAGASFKLSMNSFAYPTSSKAGINHLSQSMAIEFAVNKIPVRVNCIEPGIFPSELMGTRDELEKITKETLPGGFRPAPAQRPGKDEELGMAAVFLASSAGGFTNGIVMRVDGGLALVNP